MKLILKFFLTIIILLFITLIATIFWLKTENANKVISNYLSEYIAKNINNNYQIEFKNLKFTLPIGLMVEQVNIIYNKKLVASFEQIDAQIFPAFYSSEYLNLVNLLISKIKIISQDKPQNIIAILEMKTNLFFNFQQNNIHYKANLKSLPHGLLSSDISLKITGISKLRSNTDSLKFILSADNINANGVFDNNRFNQSFNFNMDYQTSIFENLLSGDDNQVKSHLEGTINASGSFLQPKITTEGNGYINLNGQNHWELPKTKWHSEFMLDFTKQDFDLDGNLKLTDDNINILANISKNGQIFHLNKFNAKSKNFTSFADLKFDNVKKLAIGTFDFSSTKLSELKSFFPDIINGEGSLKATLEKFGDFQKINISGDIKNLSTKFVRAKLLNFNFVTNDFWKFEIQKTNIKAKSLNINNTIFKELELKLANSGEFLTLASDVKIAALYPANFAINGKILSTKLKTNDLKIITNITGSFAKLNIQNEQPITINLGAEKSISMPEIKLNKGKIAFDASLSHNKITGNLLVKQIPFMLAPKFLPKAFNRALISGHLSISNTLEEPIITSDLTITDILLAKKDQNLGKFKLSSSLYNEQISFKGEFYKKNKIISDLKAKLPCKLGLVPFNLSSPTNDYIEIDLNFYEEFNLLSLIALPQEHQLFGALDGKMSVRGSFNSPIINGLLNLKKAEYKHKKYGIKIKNIAAKILAQNKKIMITDLVANDTFNNLIKGSGEFFIDNNYPFMLNFATEKFNLINSPYLQGEIAGKLSLEGDKEKSKIKGNFDLGPMEFKIPENFSQEVPTVNVVKIFDEDQVIHKNKNSPYIFELDIILKAKQQVYIRGWGVDTMLLGNLHIKNNVSEPYIFGELSSKRGRYQEFGKSLNVNTGILRFDGPINPSPYLNIIGVTNIDGVEIRLILSGSIFSLDISIESTPAMPQGEALSLLLFGKNQGDISQFEALSLANSMKKLSGHGGGFDALAIGRKILGVDDISIKNNSNTGGTSVGIGKYINNKVYLEVEQDSETNATKTRVEFEITPKISVEAINTKNSANSVGINWRFDY